MKKSAAKNRKCIHRDTLRIFCRALLRAAAEDRISQQKTIFQQPVKALLACQVSYIDAIAEGRSGERELSNILNAVRTVPRSVENDPFRYLVMVASGFFEEAPQQRSASCTALETALASLTSTAREPAPGLCPAETMRAIIRDVIGDPFRVVTLPSFVLSWGGGQVLQLARAIVESRTFDDLPVLADALEEAGCRDEGLLSHLRRERHVPGCWSLELVLSEGADYGK